MSKNKLFYTTIWFCSMMLLSAVYVKAATGVVVTQYGITERIDGYYSGNYYFQSTYKLQKPNAGVEACIRVGAENHCNSTANLGSTAIATLYGSQGASHSHSFNAWDDVTRISD